MGFQEDQNKAMSGVFPGNNADHGWPQGVGADWAGRKAPDPQSGKGHELYVFHGYGVNPARMNGADLEPIPITPVKYQNWPAMQIQLFNGWAGLNWGHKIPYDTYLRLLTSSNEKGRSYLSPGPRGVALGNQRIGPSPLNVMQQMQDGPGSQPSNPGGPGQTMGITNGGFYG